MYYLLVKHKHLTDISSRTLNNLFNSLTSSKESASLAPAIFSRIWWTLWLSQNRVRCLPRQHFGKSLPRWNVFPQCCLRQLNRFRNKTYVSFIASKRNCYLGTETTSQFIFRTNQNRCKLWLFKRYREINEGRLCDTLVCNANEWHEVIRIFTCLSCWCQHQ